MSGEINECRLQQDHSPGTVPNGAPSLGDSGETPTKTPIDEFPRSLSSHTFAGQTDDNDPGRHGHPSSQPFWAFWRLEKRKIILLCLLVTLPMTAFTITILWLIFGHLVGAAFCPVPELCPRDISAGVDIVDYYYVDYPAAQLAFIASWSSTVSFSLVATLMGIYSHVAARRFLQLPQDGDLATHHPTPYQTSTLLRVLNAELIVLYRLTCAKLKQIFWQREAQSNGQKSPPLLRSSMAVFLLSTFSSILIQAADTYLHVTTKAIELTQIQFEESNSHHYSKSLGSWCLNKPTFGSTNNSNFWGCVMEPTVSSGGFIIRNYSEIHAVDLGLSKESEIVDFVDKDGIHIATLTPKNVDPAIDWQASSFGISVQCRALRNDSCDFPEPVDKNMWGYYIPFNCTKERAGVDISGNISLVTPQTYFFDWHKFLKEPPPFEVRNVRTSVSDEMQSRAANLSDEDASDVFRNPWHWFTPVFLISGTREYVNDHGLDTDKQLNYLKKTTTEALLMHCNTTVWDLNYTVVNSQCTDIVRRPSNSSTTGISSMILTQMWGYADRFYTPASDEANIIPKTVKEIIDTYSRAVSRLSLIPLASQTTPQPALLVQSRGSKVVSKVPKAAVWTLVVANMLFALLALGLTLFALTTWSPDIHQLYTRLSITGLIAQLFEGSYAHRHVKDDEELFREHAGVKEEAKRVGIEKTASGGVVFRLVQTREPHPLPGQ